jgi:hypothetical protein
MNGKVNDATQRWWERHVRCHDQRFIGFGHSSQEKVGQEECVSFVGFCQYKTTRGASINPMYQTSPLLIQIGEWDVVEEKYLLQT